MLAGTDVGIRESLKDIYPLSKYMLSSFWHTKEITNREHLGMYLKLNEEDNYILDSGAFTMFTATKKIDLKEYIDSYISFIKKHNIKRFIELDIGAMIPYGEVLDIRERLERETGKKPMPVWHSYLGIEEFYKMVHDYEYIAIGGIANGSIKRSDYHKFIKMNHYARNRGVKVHGLGFTGQNCYKYGFYSVDSTSWTSGLRFGQVVKFQGNRIVNVRKPPNTKVDVDIAGANNYTEWCKFQRFCDQFTR